MSQTCCNRLFRGEAWACFLLRMWIGMRLMFAGLTKWKGTNEETGAIEFKPEYGEGVKQGIIDQMAASTPLPKTMIEQYATFLPWALLGVGIWIIVGLFSRLALLSAGALILSLSLGLMLLPEDIEATFRGIEILVIALALVTVKHNILAVDNLIDLAIGGDRGGDNDKEQPRRQKD